MAFSARDNQNPYIRLYCTESNWISGFVHTKGTQKVNAKISYFLSMKEFRIPILLPTFKNCTSIDHDEVNYQNMDFVFAHEIYWIIFLFIGFYIFNHYLSNRKILHNVFTVFPFKLKIGESNFASYYICYLSYVIFCR